MVDRDREELKELVLTEYAHAAFLTDPARLQGWEEEGVTLAQLRLLYRLDADPGVTAGTLADLLGVRASTVTGIVDRLVSQNLVERQADPDDRRLVRSRLTPSGRDMISRFTQENRAYIRSIFERLSDADLQAAGAALRRVNQAAQELGVAMPREPGREPPPMR